MIRSQPPSTATSHDLARWRQSYCDEASGALLYRSLSELEPNPRIAAGLRHLAELERAQADYWASRLPAEARPERPDLTVRDRIVLLLARRIGVRPVLPVLAADAVGSVQAYRAQPDAAAVLEIELQVATEAAALAASVRPERAVLDVAWDHRRQTAANGSLRAAVFGINDGLVSNLSLVMGVAGAAPPNEFIALAGLAGLLAGAFSMAAGEYISMLSQRELLERQIDVERQHIALAPAAERAMLSKRYQEKGIPAPQADEIAARVMADPERALDTIAREQLGLDPDELGSPRAAALASFGAFAAGALVPLLAFVFASGLTAIVASAILSAVALFLVGVGVSLFTGRPFLISSGRMLALGAAAVGVTFLIGRLIGVSVAG